MCSCRVAALLLLTSTAVADQGDYIIAGGIESDTAGTLAGTLLSDYSIGEETWLSLAVARTEVDLEQTQSLSTSYLDAGLDHYFDPVGVRVSAAYWGDNEILDSLDTRLSLYLRERRYSISAEVEHRDFEFDIPASRFFDAREVGFDALGFGATARTDVSENVSLLFSGVSYDYSVDLRLDQNRPIAQLLNVSRLSLINSLIDYRASAGVGIDQGLSQWTVNLATWRGAVDQSRTVSATARFLTPLGDRTDIEFGLGYDDSELYGNVTFFSLFLYFYGGK